MQQRQNFTIDERLAFWMAYEKKCIYCIDPILELSRFEIDHILPVSLLQEPIKFKNILDQYQLPSHYNLNSYYNLVVSCMACNRRKRTHTQHIVNPTLLEVAQKKAVQVEGLVKKYRRKLILNTEEQLTTVPFQYMFRDRLVKGSMSKSKLLDLYDLPVNLGSITDFTLK